MRKLLFLIPLIFLLVGCPSQKEVKESMDDLKEKKAGAMSAIEARDFSLEGFLKTHDYFFNFGEKVHLMMAEEKATKMIQSYIKDVGVKGFCEAFIMPTSLWKTLEDHCASGSFYKCSPEIKDYQTILAKFKEISGPEFLKRFQSEPQCN